MGINVSNGKYTFRSMSIGTDPDGTDTIDANGNILIADIEDLDDVTVYCNCTSYAGGNAATIHVDASPDGVNWILDYASDVTNANYSQSNQAIAIATLSNTSGMPQPMKQVRLRCSAYTGTGVWTGGVSGRQTSNYR
jgi:hypothetical protein